ncbi:2,3,4,5-tetrahydropyridine-2,6-dicarboxylate N-succinyltransferase [Candidatus Vidania fulgoroideorum]
MFNFKVKIKNIYKIYKKKKNIIDLSIGEVKNFSNNIIKNNLKKVKLFSIYNKISSKNKTLKVIKNYLKKNFNTNIKKKYITTTMGNRNAIYNFFLLLKKNCKYIAIKKPFYPYYKYLSIFFKKKFFFFKKFSDIIKKKNKINLVIICNPENPTGLFYNKDIIKIIKKTSKYNINFLIDECYINICKKNKESICKIFKKYKKNLTIINSLSKRSRVPGLKSGYIITSKKNIKKINILKNLSNTEISEYNQMLSRKLWKDNKQSENIRKNYLKKIKECTYILKKNKIKFIKNKGTFYIFINIKKTKLKSVKFCKLFYKNYGVKLLPGKIFGNDNYVRIALVENKNICKKSIKKICFFIKNYKINKINKKMDLLEKGKLRICKKINNKWIINKNLKKIIINYIKLNKKKIIKNNNNLNYDVFKNKFLIKFKELKKKNIRITYLSYVRNGAYVGKNVIMMPCFVNSGAFIGDNSLLDSWCTVGSCARIGKKVHISGGVGIGGVLEPINEKPVIIEDGVFIGARSEIVEGVLIKKNSVISMGVFIGKSTKIYDRNKKIFYKSYIPKESVVVPGCINYGFYSLYAAIIVKKKDILTKKKINLNKKLRIKK